MNLDDITLENFQDKITFSSDSSPENKLVISNEAFIESIIQLKLISSIEKLRGALQ